MSAENQIGVREQQILTAIVETYIASGDPVGSRTISRAHHEQLSPATIRNVMADLADAGYLEQPHTSAGRIPTPQAYRYYVEQLTGRTQISTDDEARISQSFSGVKDSQEFMERTSHVLSLISSGVGVAISTSGTKNTLDHIYFSRLAPMKILAVVVTGNGIVRDRVMRTERDFTLAELEAASRYVNDNFRGWAIDKIAAEINKRIEREKGEYSKLVRSVEQLCKEGALDSASPAQSVYVEGVANLIVTEADRDRLGDMLRALEEKQKIVDLLAAYLDTQQEAVRVVIGLEDTIPHMKNFVLIGAPARVGGEVMGSVAVIGPTRMDYEHTISAVSYIAKLFDRILNESD